jgi:hypothetical protein
MRNLSEPAIITRLADKKRYCIVKTAPTAQKILM